MFDNFTAETILEMSVGSKCSEEATANMYAEIKGKDFGGPSDDDRKFFDRYKGKKVTIKGTSYEGTLMELNEATEGFYPGSQCPFYVRIDNLPNKPVYEYAAYFVIPAEK